MKLLVWLARKAASVVVIAGLSLYSAWFVVNLYVEQMMKHYQIESLGKKIQFSDVVASLGEEWHIVSPRRDAASAASQAEQGRAAAPATAKPVGGGDAVGNGGANGVGSGLPGSTVSGAASGGANGFGAASASAAAAPPASSSPDGAGASGTTAPQGAGMPGGGTGEPSQTGERAPENAVAVSGRLSESQEQSGSGANSARSAQDSLVMSTDDFAKKKAAMSSDDKMKLFSLLMNKLPPDQLQAMSAMVEDGITSDELKQLDATLKKYLSKDEYQQILDIIQKY